MQDRDNTSGQQPATEELDWLSITTRLAAGDQTVFRVLYDFTYEIMYWEIRRLSDCDDQSIMDILQDAMIKLLKCIKPLPNSAVVKSWAQAVARSATYDWFRRQAKHRSVAVNVEFGVDEEVERVELDARVCWLESQLKELPWEMQQLIALRYRLGWSFRRIGERLGVSTKTVDGRIRRAIEKISEKAKREFDD